MPSPPRFIVPHPRAFIIGQSKLAVRPEWVRPVSQSVSQSVSQDDTNRPMVKDTNCEVSVTGACGADGLHVSLRWYQIYPTRELLLVGVGKMEGEITHAICHMYKMSDSCPNPICDGKNWS